MNREAITGLVLAGGLARRMGGRDKGLVPLAGRPLFLHVVEALRPQVGPLLINANRNPERYAEAGLPVVSDLRHDYSGPLAGLEAGLQACDTPLLLMVPCDSPFLPRDLAARLLEGLGEGDLAVAGCNGRLQPVFALLRRELRDSLKHYLDQGGRKIDTWYLQQEMRRVAFDDCPEAFSNINTPEELAAAGRRLSKGEGS